MAADLPVPEHVFVHGFLLMGEKKMSKSLGNVLDPFEAIDRYGSDALRYYCFREVSFGADGSVSAAGFEARYDTELANEYGNLASRTLAMIARYRDGVVPEAELDPVLVADFDGVADEVADLLSRAELTHALEATWKRVRRLNRYVEEREPWKLAKDDGAAAELDGVLRSLAEGLRTVSVLLHAYLPKSTVKALGALGQPDDTSWEQARLGACPGGARIEKLEPLFPKQQ